MEKPKRKYVHKKGNFRCAVCGYPSETRIGVGIHLSKTHGVRAEQNDGYIVTLPVRVGAVPHINMSEVERVVTQETPEEKRIPINGDTELTQYDLELVEMALPSIFKLVQFTEKLKNLLKKG